jgi:2-methylcitrate dehydratase PrpD
MKKQMNIGGLVAAAQIVGTPGAFAGLWEDGIAAYNAATICRSCEC